MSFNQVNNSDKHKLLNTSIVLKLSYKKLLYYTYVQFFLNGWMYVENAVKRITICMNIVREIF